MSPTKERQQELIEIVEAHLEDREWFDYDEWDYLIECEEEMTEEELRWLREHVTVTVTLGIKP